MSSFGKKKTTTATKNETSSETGTSTATSTPTVNPMIDEAVRGQAEDIATFRAEDKPLVAGPTELQTKTFNAAEGLLGNTGLFDEAAAGIRSAAGQPANTAAVTTSTLGTAPTVATYEAARGEPVKTYTVQPQAPVATVNTGGYEAGLLGPANLATKQDIGTSREATATAFRTPEAGPVSTAEFTKMGAVGGGGAATAVASTMTAPEIEAITRATSTGYKVDPLAAAKRVESVGVNAPPLGEANTYGAGTLAEAAKAVRTEIAPVATMDPAQIAAIERARVSGYDARQLADKTAIAPTTRAEAERAQAAGLLDVDLTRYSNPYDQQVTDASTAVFDADAARTRAANLRAGALNKAFGGSAYAIKSAELDSNLSRQRADLVAKLKQAGFQQATTLAGQDTDRRQSANLLNAQLGTDVSGRNAAADNARATEQARLDRDFEATNLEAENRAREFTANAGNTAGLADSAAANDRARAQAGFEQEAGLAGMEAENRASLQQGEMDQARSLFDADALNENSRARYAAENEAARTNTGARNTFDLARSEQALTAARDTAAAENAARTVNANADNEFLMSDAERAARAAEFEAAARNTVERDAAAAGNTRGLTAAQLQAEAARTNATLQTGVSTSNADNATQASVEGAKTAAQMAIAQQAQANEMARFNATTKNSASEFDRELATKIGLTNAELGTRVSLDNAGRGDEFALRGAALDQNVDLANLDANNKFALAGYGANEDAKKFSTGLLAENARFSAGETNDANALNATLNADAAKYGATAENDSLAAYLDRQQQAGITGVNATNALNSDIYAAANNNNWRNTEAINEGARYNAGAADDAAARALQAYGLLGDTGAAMSANERANLGLMGDLGDIQRGISQDYLDEDAKRLGITGGLINGLPIDAYTTRSSTGTSSNYGTSSGTGTTVEKDKPSFMSSLAAFAAL